MRNIHNGIKGVIDRIKWMNPERKITFKDDDAMTSLWVQYFTERRRILRTMRPMNNIKSTAQLHEEHPQ